MDLARVDLMGRAGLLKIFSNRNWYPVVVAETARFKKSIKPFRAFNIKTEIVGWDEKAVLLKQTFFSKQTIYCEAIVRARFLKKSGGSVLTSELLEATHIKGPSPKLPDWIDRWNQSQR